MQHWHQYTVMTYVNTIMYILYNTIVVHYSIHNYIVALLTSVGPKARLFVTKEAPPHSYQAHCTKKALYQPSDAQILICMNKSSSSTKWRRVILIAPCDAQLFVTKKTKDGQQRKPGGRHPQQYLSRGYHATPTPPSCLKKKSVVLHMGRWTLRELVTV